MVLWKKESNIANALYTNLFKDTTTIQGYNEWNRKLRSNKWNDRFLNKEYEPQKSNQISDQLRAEGNLYFKFGQFTEAMEYYSLSLRFAEPETNNISFAYANRATCFLRLTKYDECLRDIELAVQNQYPHMSKLMQRKADCECKKRQNGNSAINNVFQLTLSFKPNEKFPCMADVLEIQQNEEYGRHIVAKCDIDVGKTILVEENFVSYANAYDRIQCDTCLQTSKNFIACIKCTSAMFCSETCQNRNEFHEKFCGENINRMPSYVKFIGKSVLIALNAFSTVDELTDFVGDILSKRGKEVPSAANDPKSKYGLFLHLQPANVEILDTTENITIVYRTYAGLLQIPFVKNLFNSEQKQRFLMHLVGEHCLIISNNSYGGLNMDNSPLGTLANVMSLFNHACAPNVFNSTTGNEEICITLRPIKKGDQIFVKYLCGDRTTRQRQAILLNQWGFLCKCDKCEPHCKSTDRSIMKRALMSIRNGELVNAVTKSQCESFLKLYGHLPWSEEMDVVLKTYTKCLLNDFPSF